MQFDEIIVLGAGAIGSFYGAILSEHYPVTLIARKKHVKEIRNNGLTIAGSMFKKIKVRAEEKIERIGDNALLILSCKAYDNEKAIGEIKGKLKKDTVILVMQNGLDSEEIVRSLAGNEVIRAVVMTGVSFVRPGTIALSDLSYCNIHESASSKRIERVFRKTKVPCKILGEKEFRKCLFEKAIMNSVVNPLGALMEVNNGGVVGDRLVETKKALFREGCQAAKAEGIDLDAGELFAWFEKFLKGSKNKSSMLQDILKGRKTEIDFINGKLLELGKKHGIPMPVNKAMVELVRFKEQLASG